MLSVLTILILTFSVLGDVLTTEGVCGKLNAKCDEDTKCCYHMMCCSHGTCCDQPCNDPRCKDPCYPSKDIDECFSGDGCVWCVAKEGEHFSMCMHEKIAAQGAGAKSPVRGWLCGNEKKLFPEKSNLKRAYLP